MENVKFPQVSRQAFIPADWRHAAPPARMTEFLRSCCGRSAAEVLDNLDYQALVLDTPWLEASKPLPTTGISFSSSTLSQSWVKFFDNEAVNRAMMKYKIADHSKRCTNVKLISIALAEGILYVSETLRAMD